MDLSIVIPTRNESENIVELISRIEQAIEPIHISYELLFIDGHSIDTTVTLLKNLVLSKTFISFYTQKNSGKALAIIEGIQYAKSDTIVMIDADLQYPPEALVEMYRLSQTYPVVVARRSVRHESVVRRWLSIVHAFLYGKLLFGLQCDIQSGLKLFPKSVGLLVPAEKVSRWTFDLYLLRAVQKHHLSIGEVPIIFSERSAGVSKVSILRSFWEHTKSAVLLRFFIK